MHLKRDGVSSVHAVSQIGKSVNVTLIPLRKEILLLPSDKKLDCF